MTATLYIGPRPSAPAARLINARVGQALLDDQDFTEHFVMADGGHPQFPFWRPLILLILATQIILLVMQQSELQLRYRPRSVPRPIRISRTHQKTQANAVRLTQFRKEARQ